MTDHNPSSKAILDLVCAMERARQVGAPDPNDRMKIMQKLTLAIDDICRTHAIEHDLEVVEVLNCLISFIASHLVIQFKDDPILLITITEATTNSLTGKVATLFMEGQS